MTKNSPSRLLFLFQLYLNNECNQEQLTELLEGLKATNVDEHLDTITLSLWEAIRRHDSTLLTEEMKLKLQAEAQLLMAESNLRRPVKRLINFSAYKKIAASIALIVLLGAGFYFLDSNSGAKQEIQAPIAIDYYESGRGERKQMLLPDGSVVYLNSDTKLGVAKIAFNNEKREVWLEEGEAFFEVAKNPEKPFIVHTHNLETTVKGTSFNIKAYKELDESSVSVRDGRVEVRNGGSLLGTLTQNRQIVYNKISNSFEEHQTSWEDAAAWMESRLVIKQANSKELKLRLRQHFGVEVEIRGTALQGKQLSCSFQSRVTLKEVLDGLSLLYGIKYDDSNPDKVILYP